MALKVKERIGRGKKKDGCVKKAQLNTDDFEDEGKGPKVKEYGQSLKKWKEKENIFFFLEYFRKVYTLPPPLY